MKQTNKQKRMSGPMANTFCYEETFRDSQSDSPVMYEDIQVIQQSGEFTPQNFTSTIYNATIAYPAPSKSFKTTMSMTPSNLTESTIQADSITQKFNFLGYYFFSGFITY